jgi:hypothetical protein
MAVTVKGIIAVVSKKERRFIELTRRTVLLTSGESFLKAKVPLPLPRVVFFSSTH